MSIAAQDPSLDLDAPVDAGQQKKLLLSFFIGSTIEWYDFMLYAFLAPVVFDRLFFPKLSPVMGAIAVFSVLAVGYLARPLGGVVFGHFGDRVGRKPIMVLTLTMMGLSTTAMGFLPVYETIGLWAPIVMVSLRFLQGFAIGGESTGAPVYTTEAAPSQRRGLFAAIVQSGGTAGIVAATFATIIVIKLPQDSLLSWGWRVPFILSIVLALLGLYVRTQVEESPAFKRALARNKPEWVPAVTVVRDAFRPLFTVFCGALTDSSVPFFAGVFGVNYAVQNLHMDRGSLLNAVLIASCIGVLSYPCYGYLSDRFGRRPVMATGNALVAIFVLVAFFPLLDTGNVVYAGLAIGITSLLALPAFSTSASFHSELFPDARYRFTGAALGRQLGATFGGGFMPLVANSLVASSHGDVTSVEIYFAAICAISFVAVLLAPETRHAKV